MLGDLRKGVEGAGGELTTLDEGVAHIGGQDVGLMVRGFAAALEDPQILVQRGILDLLTTTLKIDSVAFKGCEFFSKSNTGGRR